MPSRGADKILANALNARRDGCGFECLARIFFFQCLLSRDLIPQPSSDPPIQESA